MRHQNCEQVPLPTKEEAEKITEPIREILHRALAEAITDWPKFYDKVRHILSSRAQSNIIHDHIVHHAKVLLAGIPGIKVFRQRGIFTVAVADAADVRFKKLDKKLRASNVRTKQSTSYALQLRLDGFADLPRLTAGYVLDDLRLALARAVVTLQVGRSVLYHIPLTGESGQGVLSFPKSVTPPAAPVRSRVRAKRVAQKSIGKE